METASLGIHAPPRSIWNNFSIFRTNCAILTLYIRTDPRTCRGRSLGSFHVAWSTWWELRDSLADFSQWWQEIRQGLRSRVLICRFMLWANAKGEFFRVENKTSISRCEWITANLRFDDYGLRLRVFLGEVWDEMLCARSISWVLLSSFCYGKYSAKIT